MHFVRKHINKPYAKSNNDQTIVRFCLKKLGIFDCYNCWDLNVITVIPAYPTKYNKLTQKQGKHFEALYIQN